MAKNKNKAAEPELEDEGTEEGTETGDTTEANGNGDGTKKKGYETLVIGVSKIKKPLRDALEAQATKLGCKPSDLIWYGIEQTLKNPPKVAPQGASTNVGTASGFWTVIDTDSKGRATNVRVVEVATRGEIQGRLFVRYKKGEDKERARAKNQAIRAAQADAKMIGQKTEIEVQELETAAA
jgi:hypothetical protein